MLILSPNFVVSRGCPNLLPLPSQGCLFDRQLGGWGGGGAGGGEGTVSGGSGGQIEVREGGALAVGMEGGGGYAGAPREFE